MYYICSCIKVGIIVGALVLAIYHSSEGMVPLTDASLVQIAGQYLAVRGRFAFSASRDTVTVMPVQSGRTVDAPISSMPACTSD